MERNLFKGPDLGGGERIFPTSGHHGAKPSRVEGGGWILKKKTNLNLAMIVHIMIFIEIMIFLLW